MSLFQNILIISIVALVFSSCGRENDSVKPLVIFCATGMTQPVTEIAERYQADYGVPVEIQFGGSGTLLAKLDFGNGDIYLAADSSYTDLAKEKGLVTDTFPVASIRAGFGVAKPKGDFQDFRCNKREPKNRNRKS